MPTVLIQKGHHAPREPGFETGTGAAGEIEVVDKIGNQLALALNKDSRFRVRMIPGLVPPDIRSGAYEVDAYIALHCDGSTDKTRRGWGIGYPSGAVNRKLSDIMGAELEKIHPSDRIRDNYTSAMSGYYGYSRVPTPGPEILIEHGFVSSPTEKRWLLDNAALIARTECAALLKFFGLPAKPPKPADSWITPSQAQEWWDPDKPIWENLPGPKGKPEWFWQADKELQRRRGVLRGAG
jgi:N-acetylmuramoyl-L-alanine amidase